MINSFIPNTDFLTQVFLSDKNAESSSFFGDSLVTFLVLLVHVSVGTAHAQSVSIAKLFEPLTILKNPFSPQYVPHEFLTLQYGIPFSTPYPTTDTI